MVPQKSGPPSPYLAVVGPCVSGFFRSQSGTQSALASVHVRVTFAAMRDVGLPMP